jgi:hypothetical protein
MTTKLYFSWSFLVALIALISGRNICIANDLGKGDDESSSKQVQLTQNSRGFKFRTEAARKRWKSTFEDIQKIVLENPQPKKASFYDQWKLFLDTGVEVTKEERTPQIINGTTILADSDKKIVRGIKWKRTQKASKIR